MKTRNTVDCINNNIDVQLKPIVGSNEIRSLQEESISTDELDNSAIDTQLADWLVKNNIDFTTRQIILSELFTFDNFLYATEKDDIRRLGLK